MQSGDVDDERDLNERRLSNLLIDRRLFTVESRVAVIEADFKKFATEYPTVIEEKLKARATADRETKEAKRDLTIRRITLICVVIGAVCTIAMLAIAWYRMAHGV